jgi:hypothetical protein
MWTPTTPLALSVSYERAGDEVDKRKTIYEIEFAAPSGEA